MMPGNNAHLLWGYVKMARNELAHACIGAILLCRLFYRHEKYLLSLNEGLFFRISGDAHLDVHN